MHPRIIITKRRIKTKCERRKSFSMLAWLSPKEAKIGYGHFEIISLKDLVWKSKTRGKL
jgi:hypothetical protein